MADTMRRLVVPTVALVAIAESWGAQDRVVER